MSDVGPPIDVEAARGALRDGTGRGVKVAVIDSGVELSHPGLDGLTLIDDIAVTQDGMRVQIGPGNGRDVFGHGTAIAGIIRALAPEAELGSFRVLGDNLTSRTEIICEGARQAIDRGYHIFNCSFGCAMAAQVLQYKSWVDRAFLEDRHVVAAASNVDRSKVEWPGHFSSVLTACVGPSQTATDVHYIAGSLVEFALRGQDVEVLWMNGRKKVVTGTSYAAPHLTALVARLLSLYPGLTPHEVEALLRRLAVPVDPCAQLAARRERGASAGRGLRST
jgi:subtilisin